MKGKIKLEGPGTIVRRYSGPCPICERKIDADTLITCKRCWPLVPAPERMALASMYARRQPLDAKLEKVARIVREKHPELAPAKVQKDGSLG